MTQVPGGKTGFFVVWLAMVFLVSCSKNRPLSDEHKAFRNRMAALTDSLYSDPFYVRDQLPALLRQSADSTTYYALLNLYAKTHVMMGETAEARMLLGRVAGFAAAGNDRSLLAEVYNAIAVTCDLSGDSDSTLYWLHQAEGLMTSPPQTDWKEQLLMNLADVYNRKQDFARGLIITTGLWPGAIRWESRRKIGFSSIPGWDILTWNSVILNDLTLITKRPPCCWTRSL